MWPTQNIRDGDTPSLPVLIWHDDVSADPPVVPRLLQVEAAHHCSIVLAHAGQPEPAVHQRGYEPVRPHLPRTTQAGRGQMARRNPRTADARGGHAKVH